MVDTNPYRQRVAELARRAQRIRAPELRLLYLGLAARYDRLARFRERAALHAGGDPAANGLPDRGPRAADRPGAGSGAGPLGDMASRED